jgi:hypothetical protein
MIGYIQEVVSDRRKALISGANGKLMLDATEHDKTCVAAPRCPKSPYDSVNKGSRYNSKFFADLHRAESATWQEGVKEHYQ